jgi:arginase
MNNSIKSNIIGVPLDLGAFNLGVGIGPDAFRFQDVVSKLESTGMVVRDSGNVHVHERSEVPIGDNPKLHYIDEIVRVSDQLAKLSHQIVETGEKPIILGGDHSICLGAVAGASVAVHGDLGLIYFDAHGDMNTDETTLTGNIHGMHLASLLGYGSTQLSHVYGEQSKIAKENLLHIGGSDMDQAELDLITNENLTAYTMFDILSSNLGPLFKLIDELLDKVSNIWISLDLDSIDAIYAPAAGMPNKKGLTYREIATLAQYIGKSGKVIGIDVVEYNPLQDEEGKTAELAIELIATFFGLEYSWYKRYLERNKI